MFAKVLQSRERLPKILRIGNIFRNETIRMIMNSYCKDAAKATADRAFASGANQVSGINAHQDVPFKRLARGA